jgi:hypothetical protein
LASPKLRIKLSPAELDKQLLELYDAISESPGGDVIRVVGGAGRIGLQNLYLKRQRQNITESNNILDDTIISLMPAFDVKDVRTSEKQRTASQWVRWSLRRNQEKLARSLRMNLSSSTSSKERSSSNDNSAVEEESADTTTTTTSLMAKPNKIEKRPPYYSNRLLSSNGNVQRFHGGSPCAWHAGASCRRKQPPRYHRSLKVSILI